MSAGTMKELMEAMKTISGWEEKDNKAFVGDFPYDGSSIAPVVPLTYGPVPTSWTTTTVLPSSPPPKPTKNLRVRIRVNPAKYLTKEDMLRDVKKRAAVKLANLLMEDGNGVKVFSLEGNKGSKSKVLELSIDLVLE